MGTRLTTMLLVVAVSYSARVSAEDAAWQTLKIKNGMTIQEHRRQIDQARTIIQECDRIITSMQEQDRHLLLADHEFMLKFVSDCRPRIDALIADVQQLSSEEVLSSAGEIPKVANIVLISMSFEGSNAFETMLKLYEEDRKAAIERLGRLERQLPRKWTSKTGTQSVVAEFVSADETTVVIRRLEDGKTVAVPIEKLSTNDRRFIKRSHASKPSTLGHDKLKQIGIESRSR